jgi:oligosaccharide repeat unit polymerase
MTDDAQSLYWIALAIGSAATWWYVAHARIGWNNAASWALLTMAHGLILKPLFVAFEYPSSELIDITLLQNITLQEYWMGGLFSLVPYALFVAFMFTAGKYHRRVPALQMAKHAVSFREAGLYAILAVAVAGLIGFFIQFPQLLESANKNSIATTDLADYNSGGIWRSMIDLAYVVSICAMLNASRPALRRRNLALAAVSALLWLAYCLLSDQRGLVIFSVVTLLLAYSRFIGPVPRRAIAGIGIVLVCAIIGKTVLRLQAESNGAQADAALVAANFIGQNLIENGKTASVVKAVPHKLDFQYGKTYLDAVLILIPRSLYPDKTTVNLDTVIGNKVFECDAFGACGVPPGFVAESYLNFGPLGVLVCAALYGLLIGHIDARFNRTSKGRLFDLFFLYSFIYCGMAILGSGMSGVITQVITQSAELTLVWFIAGRRRVASRSTASVGAPMTLSPAATKTAT